MIPTTTVGPPAARRQSALAIVLGEVRAFFDAFLGHIPGRTGMALRTVFWRRRFREFGPKTYFRERCVVVDPQNISLGSNVRLSDGVRLYAGSGGEIVIGDRSSFQFATVLDASDGGRIVVGREVMMAPQAFVRASNHAFGDLGATIRSQGHTPGEIIIGDNVWIGANVVILPDVSIGDGAIIGAGSVVTRSIPPNAIAVGNPARVIKNRGK